mmetsp:Transcript_20626/g.48482  ORF Transcript_20626/g.48482 Transcript_20626/m.48482 type:complete len:426 (-) Transcript_20626:1736-3013(-)
MTMAPLSLLQDDRDHLRQPVSSESRRKHARSQEHDDCDEGDDVVTDKAHLLYAQKLNNNAAMCIGIGYYERAIQSLQEALKCSQKQSDESLMQVCRCRGCRYDSSIDFSADFVPSETTDRPREPTILDRGATGYDDEESSDDEFDYVSKRRDFDEEYFSSLTKSISHPKVQKVVRRDSDNSSGEGKNASWSIKDEYCDEEMKEHPDQEIYKRPIRVTREGHPMGSSLFLVINFNLALAHHLEVAATYNHRSYNPKSAHKAVLFYELTSTYEKKILADPNSCWDSLSSVRFNTILDNNLNKLLCIVPDKCVPATQRLISNVLDAIDDETDRLSGREPKRTAATKRSKHSGVPSREGIDGSSLARSKKPTSSLSKLELALGDMSPSIPGKKKLQVPVVDMTVAMSRSSISSKGSLKSSRGRMGREKY